MCALYIYLLFVQLHRLEHQIMISYYLLLNRIFTHVYFLHGD